MTKTLRIGIIGRKNSGKSTLVNALVGHIVTETEEEDCTKCIHNFRLVLEDNDNPQKGHEKRNEIFKTIQELNKLIPEKQQPVGAVASVTELVPKAKEEKSKELYMASAKEESSRKDEGKEADNEGSTSGPPKVVDTEVKGAPVEEDSPSKDEGKEADNEGSTSAPPKDEDKTEDEEEASALSENNVSTDGTAMAKAEPKEEDFDLPVSETLITLHRKDTSLVITDFPCAKESPDLKGVISKIDVLIVLLDSTVAMMKNEYELQEKLLKEIKSAMDNSELEPNDRPSLIIVINKVDDPKNSDIYKRQQKEFNLVESVFEVDDRTKSLKELLEVKKGDDIVVDRKFFPIVVPMSTQNAFFYRQFERNGVEFIKDEDIESLADKILSIETVNELCEDKDKLKEETFKKKDGALPGLLQKTGFPQLEAAIKVCLDGEPRQGYILLRKLQRKQDTNLGFAKQAFLGEEHPIQGFIDCFDELDDVEQFAADVMNGAPGCNVDEWITNAKLRIVAEFLKALQHHLIMKTDQKDLVATLKSTKLLLERSDELCEKFHKEWQWIDTELAENTDKEKGGVDLGWKRVIKRYLEDKKKKEDQDLDKKIETGIKRLRDEQSNSDIGQGLSKLQKTVDSMVVMLKALTKSSSSPKSVTDMEQNGIVT